MSKTGLTLSLLETIAIESFGWCARKVLAALTASWRKWPSVLWPPYAKNSSPAPRFLASPATDQLGADQVLAELASAGGEIGGGIDGLSCCVGACGLLHLAEARAPTVVRLARCEFASREEDMSPPILLLALE